MITQNDIEKARQTCYSIYEKYQSTMAGNSDEDTDKLENNFNEICAEFGLNIEDTWEWCENQADGMFAYNGT